MHIYLDIETIPGQSPEVRKALRAETEQAKAEVQAPANYKDPAKIEAYIAEKHTELEAKADEVWRKTAFHGDRGEVVCIAWAVDNEPVSCVFRGLPGQEHEADEAHLLRLFFNSIKAARSACQNRLPVWVGHNVRDFDLRFLFQRAVILGVKPPFELPCDARPGSDRVFDTQEAWAGWRNYISLDRLCTALGIPGKGSELDGEAIDGSKVWDFVQRGEVEKVATYCRADVERVRAAHARLTFTQSDALPLAAC